MAQPRNIQSPLSQLLPNSEYASSRQAWTADRLGEENVSTTCVLARLEKCTPLALGGYFRSSWGVENRDDTAQTASTSSALARPSSTAHMKCSLRRKGKLLPRWMKKTSTRWVMSGWMGPGHCGSYSGRVSSVAAATTSAVKGWGELGVGVVLP